VVKERVELYLHSPNTPSWCGALLKHRDNFTFTIIIIIIKGKRVDEHLLEYLTSTLDWGEL
jgi:hypothetical protein